jgi:DNA repair protein RadC
MILIKENMIMRLKSYNAELLPQTSIEITRTCNVPLVSIRLVKESGITYGSVPTVSMPADVANLAFKYFDIVSPDREQVLCLCCDAKNKPIGLNLVSVGDLGAAIVNPREVLKPAIMMSAASIFLIHNNPSGDSTPSIDDVNITRRIIAACEIIGINFYDHIVIGDNHTYTSLKDKGLI